MTDGIILADPDCRHPMFDLTGRCRSCARDFSEQRAAGLRSEPEVEESDVRMSRAMIAFPDDFPGEQNCGGVLFEVRT